MVGMSILDASLRPRTLLGALFLGALLVAASLVWISRSTQSIEAQASADLHEIMADRAVELSKRYGELCGLDVESLHEGQAVGTGLSASDAIPEAVAIKAANDGKVQGAISENYIRNSHVVLVTENKRSGGMSPDRVVVATGAVLIRYDDGSNSAPRWEVFKSESLYPCYGDFTPRGIE